MSCDDEDVGRVTRAVANMWSSLEKTGQIGNHIFYRGTSHARDS